MPSMSLHRCRLLALLLSSPFFVGDLLVVFGSKAFGLLEGRARWRVLRSPTNGGSASWLSLEEPPAAVCRVLVVAALASQFILTVAADGAATDHGELLCGHLVGADVIVVDHDILAGPDATNAVHPRWLVVSHGRVATPCSREGVGALASILAEGEEGDGEAVHEDGAEDEEVDDGLDDGANAHGTKVAAEDGLAEGLDVWDELPESKDDGDALCEEHADGEDDEAPDGEADGAVDKIVPGDEGANVDEGGDVEEQIDDVGEVGVLGLLCEPTIPGEGGAARKRGEQVVGAEQHMTPILAMASEMYWATKDSRSMSLLRSEKRMNLRARKGESGAVIAAGLAHEHVTDVGGDVLLSPWTTDDGLGQDGIGGGDAGGDDERVEKVEAWDEGVDETGGDEPAPGHDGAEEDGDGLPVAEEVLFGQLDADGKDGECDGDAHDLEGVMSSVVGPPGVTPSSLPHPAGLKRPMATGPTMMPKAAAMGSLAEVEAFLDEEGTDRRRCR
ncbi:hypothetical protein L1887_43382 [Cichorium endivia]|nr:hypothetical protein L1887_43382 [Cichorium endivia]